MRGVYTHFPTVATVLCVPRFYRRSMFLATQLLFCVILVGMSSVGLSNLQLELLRLYGANVSDEALVEIKGMLARYFADRASDEMDDLWNERGITADDMPRWAGEHNRLEDRP